jgi:type 1 glutamine amidotransferase
MEYDLIIPCITMGEIPEDYVKNIDVAVSKGTGLAGCHGGMCDAFRNSTLWQFITGGQWVAHPGNDKVEYTVNVTEGSSPITSGIMDFKVCSEQYYLHVDPAIEVLATTRFPVAPGNHCTNKPVDMPVAWTKYWGYGRVFYSSIGHNDDVFDKFPMSQVLMERGMLWAAEGKSEIERNCVDLEKYDDQTKKY